MRTGTTAGQARERSGWLTAAAVILLVEGSLGLFYLPILGPPGPVPIYVAVVSGASLAAAAGILLHRRWARVLAGLLAAISLLLDGLAVAWTLLALVRDEPVLFDVFLPISVVAWLVVAFAVARRW
jgi:hypothetical protein